MCNYENHAGVAGHYHAQVQVQAVQEGRRLKDVAVDPPARGLGHPQPDQVVQTAGRVRRDRKTGLLIYPLPAPGEAGGGDDARKDRRDSYPPRHGLA